MRSKIKDIIVSKCKTKIIYNLLLKKLDYTKPHLFIKTVYDLYKKDYPNNPSINGRIFEYLICECLMQEHIFPFYYQAKFSMVPNCDFDIVLYHQRKPIVLTIKTSLRERYKQADLESFALKQVYRQSKSFLITLSEKEIKPIKNKIQSSDILGIDDCIYAYDEAFDIFIRKLQKYQFCKAQKIIPIKGTILTN